MGQRGGRSFKKENFNDIDRYITYTPGSAETGRRKVDSKDDRTLRWLCRFQVSILQDSKRSKCISIVCEERAALFR
ncbi:hypothetical protein TNCV_3384711 [Trichonephila clavipes]|uniref:Uncharacterized protein n=1 Tax=Trichonephila clavipes TaxID=2585209 RepID=A0A8X6VQL5_TRICX|nr:hypothetical protein TNCV_3384711 [Trichonephila clavipes]